MKSYVQPGIKVTVAAPSDVFSDDVVIVGNLFGVATNDAATGDDVSLSVTGVHRLPKSNVALAAGSFAYWDGTQVQDDDNGGANILIGVVTRAALAADETVIARLVDPGFQTIVGSQFEIAQKLDQDAGVADTDYEATIDDDL